MNDNIGIVFIYGAGLGSFIWDDLTPLLHFPFLTIDFPNREVSEKANYDLTLDDYTKSAIEQVGKWKKNKIILVTHSIGGCIGLKVADHLGDNLTGFVGISSAIPESGNTFNSLFSFPQNILMPLVVTLFGTRPPDKSIEKTVGNDLTPEQTAEVIKRYTPEAKLLFTTKVNYNRIDTNTLYIKLKKDRVFSDKLQNRMIKNLNAQKVATLDSGHLPMKSKPKELSDILNNFISETK